MPGLPDWAVMWTIAVAVYAVCKWLTWWRTKVRNVPAWRHAAYLLAWPGLDAATFLDGGIRYECRTAEWLTASSMLTVGAVLLFGVARLIPPQHTCAIGWVGMIGIALMLHFGAFQLLSCAWRSIDVTARPLMNRPLMSTSISDFWSRRWNTAFRDLTFQFFFRPVSARFGPRAGVLAGFLFSGLAHDVVISVPAHGGYGGPTMFFAIQGTAIVLERSEFGRRLGLNRGPRARLFALAVLVAPIGILFHRRFVVGIVTPFMRALGAIS